VGVKLETRLLRIIIIVQVLIESICAIVMILPESGLGYAEDSFGATSNNDRAELNKIDFSVLDQSILDDLSRSNTPGCAVAIVRGGRVCYAKGFGVTNIRTRRPVTPETLFLIGSTTKAFTAYTLLSMLEERCLDVNKSLGNRVEDLSPRLSNITFDQLLCHTAGLKDIRKSNINGKLGESYYENGLNDYIRTLNDTIFFSEPGELFSYSSLGYSIAGYLIKNMSGMLYQNAVESRVLKNLGMNCTTFYPEKESECLVSPGYVFERVNNQPKIECVGFSEEDIPMWPAGFLFSNVRDMSRFAIALMNNGTLDGKQVLSSQVIKEMLAPHANLVSAYPDGNYGYGMWMYNQRGVDVVEHSGTLKSFACKFMMVPKYKFAIIILGNCGSLDMSSTEKKAFEMMLPLERDVSLNSMDLNENEMRRCVGDFSSNQDSLHPNSFFRVRTYDGKLITYIDGRWAYIKKTSEDQLYIDEPGAPIYIGFMTGKDGEVEYFCYGFRAYPKIDCRI
jgi:CubicO group peptidase (beta-lactamase class C family)